MADNNNYELIKIGETYTYVCLRCASVVWRSADHDAWHEYVEGTAQNFSELLKVLTKLAEVL